MGEGSSPLTRGKPVSLTEKYAAAGLIPAHAGKTCQNPRRAHSLTAHPRSRGENPVTLPRRASLLGSSPLTRGKLCVRGCLR
mgnify:CR=1 FL=1